LLWRLGSWLRVAAAAGRHANDPAFGGSRLDFLDNADRDLGRGEHDAGCPTVRLGRSRRGPGRLA